MFRRALSAEYKGTYIHVKYGDGNVIDYDNHVMSNQELLGMETFMQKYGFFE